MKKSKKEERLNRTVYLNCKKGKDGKDEVERKDFSTEANLQLEQTVNFEILYSATIF